MGAPHEAAPAPRSYTLTLCSVSALGQPMERARGTGVADRRGLFCLDLAVKLHLAFSLGWGARCVEPPGVVGVHRNPSQLKGLGSQGQGGHNPLHPHHESCLLDLKPLGDWGSCWRRQLHAMSSPSPAAFSHVSDVQRSSWLQPACIMQALYQPLALVGPPNPPGQSWGTMPALEQGEGWSSCAHGLSAPAQQLGSEVIQV